MRTYTCNYRTGKECDVIGSLLTNTYVVQRGKNKCQVLASLFTSLSLFLIRERGVQHLLQRKLRELMSVSTSEHLVCCLAHSLHPLNGNYYLYFHLLGAGAGGGCLLDLSWFPSDTEGNLDPAPGWGQSSEATAGSDPRAWEGWVSPMNF